MVNPEMRVEYFSQIILLMAKFNIHCSCYKFKLMFKLIYMKNTFTNSKACVLITKGCTDNAPSNYLIYHHFSKHYHIKQKQLLSSKSNLGNWGGSHEHTKSNKFPTFAFWKNLCLNSSAAVGLKPEKNVLIVNSSVIVGFHLQKWEKDFLSSKIKSQCSPLSLTG